MKTEIENYIAHLRECANDVRQDYANPMSNEQRLFAIKRIFNTIAKELANLIEVSVTPRTQFEVKLDEVLGEIRELLAYKNRMYGNSALEPVRIFSKASPIEQINVRIDDKLSRLKTSGNDHDDEDTERDLLGYLILKAIAVKGLGNEE